MRILWNSFYGENHPSAVTSYTNIGEAYSHQNKYREAIECYSKALSIQEALYGSNDQKTIDTKNKISELQSKLKEQENNPSE